MSEILINVHQNFVQGLSRISQFWGFPKAMGTIYGVLYLSPEALTLDNLVEKASVSKGTVSTNVRTLERLGMVHKHIRIGERKDYYSAETDFWKIIKGILKEREKSEFDTALRMVGDSLEMIHSSEIDPTETTLAAFYKQRLETMENFFHTLDNLVVMVMALDELRISALEQIFRNSRKTNSR